MAIGYARTESLNRSDGKNAVAAAAYIARERIEDMASGTAYDFTGKGGESPAIVMPLAVPNGEIEPERATLWNMAEKAENRRNATVARSMIGALPNELDSDAQKRICATVARFISEQHHVAVDCAIHRDPGNNHAHFLFTSRRYKGGKLTQKTRELDTKGTASKSLLAIRKHWQEACNDELSKAGFSERIDMRSYDERGDDKTGQYHLGKAAHHHHARTGENFKAHRNSSIKQRNAIREAGPKMRGRMLDSAKASRKASAIKAKAHKIPAPILQPAIAATPKQKQEPSFIDSISAQNITGNLARMRAAAIATANNENLLPGQWLIPPTATPEEVAVIIAHNKDVANAHGKFSKKFSA